MKRKSVEAAPERILPTLIHIQTHLNDDLSLAQLAKLAAVSPYHFHRLFRATTGETLKQYTLRLRLERAAFELKISVGSILEIALNAGFNSHETFSRAFKRQFSITPGGYRQVVGRLLNDQEIQSEPRESLNHHTAQYSLSSLRLQNLAPMPLAFSRCYGNYENVDMSLYDQLIAWARKKGFYTGDNLLLGIGHDDPGITPIEKVRFDACIQVPGTFQAEGDIAFQTLPTGLFASMTYVGPYGPVLTEAYGHIYQTISQKPGYRMLGLPAIEIYRTTRINPEYELNETDIYLPVEQITKIY